MEQLLAGIQRCTLCSGALPNDPKPILQISASSKVLIIGQAPGRRVHDTGIPWDDASGNNLRQWLGVDKQKFYDARLFALMPMGFCFPGTGRSGDLPPRKECATTWHQILLDHMNSIKLTLLIGQYAQNYYLGNQMKDSLTETVKSYTAYLPKYLPLPHPSPRNNIWFNKNSWFESNVIPILKEKIEVILNRTDSANKLNQK